jgi:hypothetical protein
MGMDVVVGGASADMLAAIRRLFHFVALALRPLHHRTG